VIKVDNNSPFLSSFKAIYRLKIKINMKLEALRLYSVLNIMPEVIEELKEADD